MTATLCKGMVCRWKEGFTSFGPSCVVSFVGLLWDVSTQIQPGLRKGQVWDDHV